MVEDQRADSVLIIISLAYPKDAAQIAELAKALDGDRAAKREALIAAAQRDKAAAEKGEFPYRVHSHRQTWQRVTSTPRFLSLSAEIDSYAGGGQDTHAAGSEVFLMFSPACSILSAAA